MRIEAALYTLLSGDSGVSALVSTRIFPHQAPQGGALPFLVYQRISTPRDYSQSGPSLLVWPRFQITAVAATFDGARALAHALRAALSGYSGTMGGGGGVSVGATFLENEADGYEPRLMSFEPDLSVYTSRQDYIIWHQEAAA